VKRLVPFLLLAGCLRFEERIQACFADGGVCLASPDGGAEERFVELDGGGFRFSNQWRWESPLPFGHHLNAVYATGDVLVVAGEDGLLAERRQGQWVSFQQLAATTYLQSSGTGLDDLWLASSDGPLWHRDGGWGQVDARAPVISLTHFDGALYLGTSDGRLGRLENDLFAPERRVSLGDVQVGNFANGVVVLAVEDGGRALTQRDGGPFFLFDGGLAKELDVEGLFASSNDLWLSGMNALRVVDAGRVLAPTDLTVTAASPGATTAVVSTGDGLVRVEGTRSTIELRGALGLRAFHRDAANMTVWAVGENGQVYRRLAPSVSWVAESWVPTTSDVRALVPLGDTLYAFTNGGQLLRREPGRWRVLNTFPIGFADAVSEGNRLVALDFDHRLQWFDGDGQQTAQFDIASTGSAAHLFRSTAGTMVVTGAAGIFVRRAADDRFLQVWSEPSTGLGGRAEVVRVCSQRGIVELDLVASPPVAALVDDSAQVAGCESVLQLDDGWLYGTGDGSSARVIRRLPGNAEQVTSWRGTTARVTALIEVRGGVAVGMDGFASMPFATWQSGTLDLTPTRVGNVLFCFRKWRGRLFAGGSGGAILERELQ